MPIRIPKFLLTRPNLSYAILLCPILSCAIFAGLIVLRLPAAAQINPPANQTTAPLIHAQANAVVVDVVVTVKDGKPALDLHKQDFSVTENGRPQTIDLFEEHATSAPPAESTSTSAPLPPLGPHTYTNQLATLTGDAIEVLLLDNLNTPEADQAYEHKQILNFIEHKTSGAPVAIFTLGVKLHLLEGFTSDRSQLEAALSGKKVAPETSSSSRNRQDVLNDDEDVSMQGNERGGKAEARSLKAFAGNQSANRSTDTLAALAQIARSLSAVPGRKNLIWFATTFPVSVFPDGDNPQTLANGRDIPDALRTTLNLLTQSRIAIYPVSAQGILTDTTMNADSAGQPNGDNFERNPLKQTRANDSNRGAMEQLAIDTGGEAVYTSNDLSSALSHALDAGAHYYTLVYTPSNSKTDGSFRNINVKTTEGNLKLDYRRGYFADDRSTPAALAPADPLAPLLAHGLPSSTQIVYRLRAVPADPQPAKDAPRAGGNIKLTGNLTRYSLDFTIPVADLDLTEESNGSHTGKVEVALIAHGKNGAAANWTAGQMSVTLRPSSFAAAQNAGIPAHFELDIPKEASSLSTGVYVLGSARSGTLEIPLPLR